MERVGMSMNVRNCKKCGRLFNYVSGMPVCPSCREGLEKKFQEVKDYIRENKEAGITEVAEACDVEVRQIKQWVREERLEFSADSPVGIDCEMCGTMIRSGRFCEKCKIGMINELDSAKPKPAPKKVEKKKDSRDNPKMRFLSE